MTRLLQDEAEGYETQRLSKWFASRVDARETIRRNFMLDEMTRPRVDPEIQNAMLKLILQEGVK